jgi:hypothetical protein
MGGAGAPSHLPFTRKKKTGKNFLVFHWRIFYSLIVLISKPENVRCGGFIVPGFESEAGHC